MEAVRFLDQAIDCEFSSLIILSIFLRCVDIIQRKKVVVLSDLSPGRDRNYFRANDALARLSEGKGKVPGMKLLKRRPKEGFVLTAKGRRIHQLLTRLYK